MHTILGAGGPISDHLALELEKTNHEVRLVSRRQIRTSGKTTWRKADLLNYPETLEAARGSEVIYLCAGLKYDKNVWKDQWPRLMQNVINVAKETGARLIFFDNVYMYGLVQGPMTEETQYNPCSVKGEVRSRIASMLMEEVKRGNIKASIARAADFYGATGSGNSFFDMMVLEKFSKKQKAQWLGDPNTLHSFTYVPDAAKAVFLLGQNQQSDNQIWHLPTAPSITGKEFIELAARLCDAQPDYRKLNKFMVRLAGMFIPAIKETVEMYYQYQHDYIFSSSKFEKAFNINPTSYEDGFKYLLHNFYSRN